MRKKASIITMHCPLNYGAVLQTYAFQTFLESKGLEVSVINYTPQYIVHNQSLMYVGDEKFRRNIFTRWLYRIYKAPSKYGRKKKFNNFRGKELHLTRRFETYEEMVSAHLDADVFFCGSDQIWNSINESCKDPAYFLGFVGDKSKRNSYAASGNMHLPLSDDVLKYSIPMINSLNNISMREASTIANIQPYINKTIVHVCDPVFLLNETQWRELAFHGKPFKKRQPYVLIYPMGRGIEIVVKKGFEKASSLGMPLYCITSSQRKDSRISKYFNTDPYTFLQLIINADYLITNSFHGTAFSIIFKKQFLTCVAEGSNQRLTSILEMCGLGDRQISAGTDTSRFSNIEYDSVHGKLDEFVLQSKEYINNIIGNGC